MNKATAYTLGFTVGFGGSYLLAVAVAWMLLAPFGYGYISAELMGAYLIWSTIWSWDTVVIPMYLKGLERHTM